MHTWVIGLDLRNRSQGALHLARWIAGRHRAPADLLHLLAVHVVHAAALRRLLREQDFDDAMAAVRDQAERLVASALGSRADLLVVAGDRPEERLAAAAQLHGAEGLLIGRQAGRGEEKLVALGQVARRLVRSLPAPLWVVPPDLSDRDIGSGPILVAVDGREDCLAALRYAARMSEELRLALRAVFVVELPEPWGEPYATMPRILAEARDRFIEEARPQAEDFLAGAGCGNVPLDVTEGPVVQRILEAADRHDAAVVVVGSRRLSLAARFFQSSVGTQLAAASPRPVVLVGPEPAT